MAEVVNNTIRIEDDIVVGIGNNKKTTILNTSTLAGEFFSKTPYTTIGVNGKGEKSANVDLAEVEGIREDLKFEGMEVAGKEIQLKLGSISFGDEENRQEYVFLYDNRLKEIAQAYKKGEDGKLQRISSDEFVINPKLNGESLNDRIKTIDNLLLFIVNNLKNPELNPLIRQAIANSKGNLKAQEVDLNNLSILRDKILAVKEIFSKLDLNNPALKSAYIEYKEELDDGQNMPTLKQLKDEKFLNETFTQTGIKGIKLSEFRKLTMTEDMLGENATLSEKDEFKEIQKLKETMNLNSLLLNMNTLYVGINEKGEIAVFENAGIEMASNGQIYKDEKLAEKLKDIHRSIGAIKQAVFHPEEIEKEKVVNAENILKTKTAEWLENEEDERLKKHLQSVIESVDINKLYSTDAKEKYEMLNKFEELFNYVKKKTVLDVERKVVSNIDILTKNKDRIRNIPYAYKPVEKTGGFDKSLLENEEDIKNVKEYLMLVKLPLLAKFENKLFLSEKNAIGATAYIDVEKNKLLQVNKGVKLDNYLTMANLGKMIDNIRNYTEEEKDSKKYQEIDKGILKYFYLNKDEKSLKTNENFKDIVEMLKPELSKLVELLQNKKFNEAKELVNSWDNSKDNNLKLFAQWSKKVGEEYNKLKMFKNVYYALSVSKDEVAKKDIQNYLTNPNMETLENLINNNVARKFRKSLTQFVNELAKITNAIAYQKEKNIEKLHELNGGVDEEKLKYSTLENIAKNIAFNVTNVARIYYVDKDGNVNIPNTLDRSFRNLDKNIVEFKESEFNNQKVNIAKLNKENFAKHLETANEIKKEVYNAVDAKFKGLMEKANERLQFKKDEKVGENIAFGIEDWDVDDDLSEDENIEVKETIQENPKEEKEVTNLIEEDGAISLDIDEDYLDPNELVKNEEVKVETDINSAKKLGL